MSGRLEGELLGDRINLGESTMCNVQIDSLILLCPLAARTAMRKISATPRKARLLRTHVYRFHRLAQAGAALHSQVQKPGQVTAALSPTLSLRWQHPFWKVP
jgi:hypothetical protein